MQTLSFYLGLKYEEGERLQGRKAVKGVGPKVKANLTVS